MRKKTMSLLACALSAALLCACGAREPKLVSTDSSEEPFSIADAGELIRPYDEAAAWLGAQEKITRAQGEALAESVDAAFPGEGENVLGMYIDVGFWEDESQQEFEILTEAFCPTMFHEGVEVTDAVVKTERSEYDDGSVWETTRLEITEAYTGENEALAGWRRTYIFDQTDDGWRFSTFDGQMNFMSDEWSNDALPLKAPVEGP